MLNRVAKDTLFQAYISFRRLSKASRKSNVPIIVLNYHRVTSNYKDDVTVSPQAFDQQMQLIRRRYHPISLREAIADKGNYRFDRSPVVVTFDDGYLDNYEEAAPILKKHGIPATFFVSTGMIGTEQPFQHDINKLGHAVPAMNWDHVRELAKDGFEIGSHTVNHTDLGRADEATVQTEIRSSLTRLKSELETLQSTFSFAFPFGREHNFNAHAKETAIEAGYACICSAYGGTNGMPLDTTDIRRQGINDQFSLTAFQAVLEGWQPNNGS